MQRILKTMIPALMIAAAAMATTSSAQTAPTPHQPTLDLAFTYAATNAQPVHGSHFWMQGGAAQVHGQFYRGWGVVADVAGAHIANINSTGVGLDLVTATFGPRYTWQPAHARYSLYGQGLVGIANGFNSVFPNSAGANPVVAILSAFPNSAGANTVADSMAVKAGGGMNLNLKPHFALRLFEADYLRTQLPNTTNNMQNNLQLAADVVLRFR